MILAATMLAVGCGQAPSPAKPTVLGRWIETPQSLQAKGFKEDGHSRIVELFKDGTAASIRRNPAYTMEGTTIQIEAGETTDSFTWSLSEDGQRIKTETQESGKAPGVSRTFVQRIVKLTNDELQAEGPGLLAGSYERGK